MGRPKITVVGAGNVGATCAHWAAARELGADLVWFTAETLRDLPTPNPSRIAARHLGVASVSEAAALKAAGGSLIVPKCKATNATLAVALAA